MFFKPVENYLVRPFDSDLRLFTTRAEVDEFFCCRHCEQGRLEGGDHVILKSVCRNGVFQLRKVCVWCGCKTGKKLFQKRVDHPGWENFLFWNPKHEENRYNAYWEIVKPIMHREAERKDSEWKAKYNAYLQSDKWKRKRLFVLARARNVCERELCFNRAWHVHHKHYKTLGNERLEDLEALCVCCHQKEHPNRDLKASIRHDRKRG